MKQSDTSIHLRQVSKIVILFSAVKVAHLIIVALTPAQFDVSSTILLGKYLQQKELLSTFDTRSKILNRVLHKISYWFLDRFLDRLVTWDAVYFVDLFANGIQYEHQFVFCPLWWRLIHAIQVNPETQFYSRLLWATLITNICHLAATVVLYFYTLSVFEKARIFSPVRMAMATLVLFVCSPAAAFLTAPYSESIAALCSFLCLFTREVSVGEGLRLSSKILQPRSANGPENGAGVKKHQRVSELQLGNKAETTLKHVASWCAMLKPSNTCIYLSSGVFAALAFGFRANCLFLGLVYVYDILYKKTKTPTLPLAAGLILGAAFLLVQIHSYVVVCRSGRGEWCESRIPSLFAYAQSHYWGNGLLQYWTMNNVPNFIFAAPTVFLLVLSIRYFGQIYPVERILPVLAVNVVFLILLLLFWHVQIITRIHTFLPAVYWLVAGLITQQNTLDQKNARLYVAYFVVWNLLQVPLFAAFLPPA